MRRVAIWNQKGGSGKTTTAVNLAAALARSKPARRVLLLDIDPQASATRWAGLPDADREPLDVFTGAASIASLVTHWPAGGFDVAPASLHLASVERILSGEPGAETILRRKLDGLRGPWDFVLIDCPPSLGFLAVSALTAADSVLVPVAAEFMALEGLATLLQVVAKVRERLNDQLALAGFLLCRADRRTRIAREAETILRKRFPRETLHTVIRQNVRLTEAPSHRVTIFEHAADSAGAKDYKAAAREIAKRESP